MIKASLLIKALKTLSEPFQHMGLMYSQAEDTGVSKEQQLINSIVKFRDSIRENAKAEFKTILEICDKYRDYDFVEMGIQLEDRKIGQPSLWKYESKEVLIEERQKKINLKLKKEQEQKAKEEEKLNKVKIYPIQMKVNPMEMFLKNEKYTQFDESGIPTHEKFKEADRPVNDKLRNKLEKQWKAQKQQYELYQQKYKKNEDE